MKNRVFKLFIASVLLFAAMFSFMPTTAEAASSKFIVKGNTSSKVVALTFDDGADGTNINKILNTLSNHNVKATFFLTGKGVEHHPQSIKNIAAQGHEIGNHSYSHPDFTTISASKIKTELEKTEAIVKRVTGKTTKPIFRAPYGATNSAVLKAVGEAGYTHTLHWDIDTIDWRGLSKTQVLNKVVNNVQPGSIVLMHTGAGAPGTPAALPDMIKQLKAKGYKFVTISEMLNLKKDPGTAPVSGTKYTVKSGDTLYSIAKRHGVTVSQMVSANKLSNANLIRVGQVLTIPKGTSSPPASSPPSSSKVTYKVKAGDTLYSIARKYGVTVNQMKAANNITNVHTLQIGKVLTVPNQTTQKESATTYKVKAGDTLYSIANRHGSSVKKIQDKNNISDPRFLQIGAVLTIPA
ncbi:LysM peptidoglycan-binding domain-containing protein [Alkalicoccus daliensis]|uniref:Polysaccharide deacetylase family sporulation protein PdaB n=1 Tax=Alkalicoccus daliensis TaxID=745820 RepID=A0A1H0EBR9_9BACI|nr:LysM peptidoglycan-binding domain-containing protein [Alkalicoccus daliensis]SDN79811.1 polysaccharide deacetylase family sporulation protein PdaB [Alkalicoccus daliensis]